LSYLLALAILAGLGGARLPALAGPDPCVAAGARRVMLCAAALCAAQARAVRPATAVAHPALALAACLLAAASLASYYPVVSASRDGLRLGWPLARSPR
jgi:hypothetical protein